MEGFQKTLPKYKGHTASVEDIMEELLTEGNLLPLIEILYQVKAIIPYNYNTAMCEARQKCTTQQIACRDIKRSHANRIGWPVLC